MLAAMTSHADLGSLISSLYSSRVASSLEGLPEATRAAAEQSMAQAHAVGVTDAASSAFTDALGIGFLAAEGCALTAAVIVRWKLPRERVPARAPQTRPRPAFEEV